MNGVVHEALVFLRHLAENPADAVRPWRCGCPDADP